MPVIEGSGQGLILVLEGLVFVLLGLVFVNITGQLRTSAYGTPQRIMGHTGSPPPDNSPD